MLDPDTFLTTLYVTCDDFFQGEDAPLRPGRPAALSRREVVTLALFGQWFGFGGERGYWRWAGRHLRGAFPTLPARAQFNRLLRAAQNDLARFAVALAEVLGAAFAAYEALDSTGAATRHAKRRGEGLPQLVEFGSRSFFPIPLVCNFPPDGTPEDGPIGLRDQPAQP